VLLDELYNAGTHFHCTAAGAPDLLFAGTAEDDRPVFDVEQLEQLQFESAAEGKPPPTPPTPPPPPPPSPLTPHNPTHQAWMPD